MNKPNPKVDFFFNKAKQWQREYEALRKICLACGLTEELKWGKPCYSLEGSNVVLIHGFKEYCALLFFKGALLKDDKGILIQQTKNVQAARQIRFTSLREVVKLRPVLKAYIKEAVAADSLYSPALYQLYYYYYFRDVNVALNYLEKYGRSSDDTGSDRRADATSCWAATQSSGQCNGRHRPGCGEATAPSDQEASPNGDRQPDAERRTMHVLAVGDHRVERG